MLISLKKPTLGRIFSFLHMSGPIVYSSSRPCLSGRPRDERKLPHCLFQAHLPACRKTNKQME